MTQPRIDPRMQTAGTQSKDYVLLRRPCRCGRLVAIEADNPNVQRLLKQGYVHVETISKKP